MAAGDADAVLNGPLPLMLGPATPPLLARNQHPSPRENCGAAVCWCGYERARLSARVCPFTNRLCKLGSSPSVRQCGIGIHLLWLVAREREADKISPSRRRRSVCNREVGDPSDRRTARAWRSRLPPRQCPVTAVASPLPSFLLRRLRLLRVQTADPVQTCQTRVGRQKSRLR